MGKKIKTVPGYHEAVEALLPEGGTEALLQGDKCLFCADGEARPAEWYAHADMGILREGAGPALVEKDGMSALAAPVQVPCCARCRKNWLAVSLTLPVCAAIGLAAAAFVGVFLPLRNALAGVHTALPFLLAAALAAAGVLTGLALKKQKIRRLGTQTDFTWKKIPYISSMCRAGWFFLKDKRPVRPVFSKEKRANDRYI